MEEITLAILLAIDPFTLIGATKTALDLVGAFSAGGEGSYMMAMMQHQTDYLRIINIQLSDIRSSIADVHLELIKMPEKTKKELDLQFKEELIVVLKGAASSYLDNVAFTPDPINASSTVNGLCN